MTNSNQPPNEPQPSHDVASAPSLAAMLIRDDVDVAVAGPCKEGDALAMLGWHRLGSWHAPQPDLDPAVVAIPRSELVVRLAAEVELRKTGMMCEWFCSQCLIGETGNATMDRGESRAHLAARVGLTTGRPAAKAARVLPPCGEEFTHAYGMCECVKPLG